MEVEMEVGVEVEGNIGEKGEEYPKETGEEDRVFIPISIVTISLLEFAHKG